MRKRNRTQSSAKIIKSAAQLLSVEEKTPMETPCYTRFIQDTTKKTDAQKGITKEN